MLSAAVGLVEQAAGGEVLLLDLVPAAEDVLDRHQPHFGELGLELGRDLFVTHAVAILGGDLLALGRVEEVEIGLGQIARAVLVGDLVDDGDRELGEQADRRRRPARTCRRRTPCGCRASRTRR